jgi:hypothetical protein
MIDAVLFNPIEARLNILNIPNPENLQPYVKLGLNGVGSLS